jgi:DNA polymerase/3'-5' exonuclease PolX
LRHDRVDDDDDAEQESGMLRPSQQELHNREQKLKLKEMFGEAIVEAATLINDNDNSTSRSKFAENKTQFPDKDDDNDEDHDNQEEDNQSNSNKCNDDFEPEPNLRNSPSSKTVTIKMTGPFRYEFDRDGAGGGGGAADPEKRQVSVNQPLVDHLRRLCDLHKAFQTDGTNDQHRARMYNSASILIKKLPFKITSSQQLDGMRGFGDSIKTKVDEFLATGTSAKFEAMTANPLFLAAEKLTKIWGVGQAAARTLMQNYNIRSIEDLRQNRAAYESLNRNQKLGLKFYEDLNQRLPRSEVELVQSIVAKTMAGLGFATTIESPPLHLPSTYDKSNSSRSVVSSSVARNCSFDPTTGKTIYTRGSLDLVTCGSYRRGLESSGDVDILICDRSNSGFSATIVASVVEAMAKMALGTAFQNKFTGSLSMTPESPLIQIQQQQEKDQQQQRQQSLQTSSSFSKSRSNSYSFSLLPRTGSDPNQLELPRDQVDQDQLEQEQQQQQLLPQLPLRFELVQTLSSADRGDSNDNQTWMGIIRLEKCRDPARCPCAHKPDGTHFARRLDIKSYKASQFAFALLYFTGSSLLNRSMRLFADCKGFHLSDKLLAVVRRINRVVAERESLVPCETEKDVFDALGLKYLSPEERSFDLMKDYNAESRNDGKRGSF